MVKSKQNNILQNGYGRMKANNTLIGLNIFININIYNNDEYNICEYQRIRTEATSSLFSSSP